MLEAPGTPKKALSWSHKAISALLEDNVYQIEVAFGMRGADLHAQVVGYSRTGKYGRTQLQQFAGTGSGSLKERSPGDTILHLAVRNNKPQCVAKLLSLGSLPTAMNQIGESPLLIAKLLMDSGRNPGMNELFEGTNIRLPTVTHIFSAALAPPNRSLGILLYIGR
jgi:hypothetical protein